MSAGVEALSKFTLKTLFWVREGFSPFLVEELTQIIYDLNRKLV